MGFQLMNSRQSDFKELTIIFDGQTGEPDVDIVELKTAFDGVKGTKFVFEQPSVGGLWQLQILFTLSGYQPNSEEMKRRLENVPSLQRTDPLVHIPNSHSYSRQRSIAYRCH